MGNLLDVQLIDAIDVSNAIAWLVSDEPPLRHRRGAPGRRNGVLLTRARGGPQDVGEEVRVLAHPAR